MTKQYKYTVYLSISFAFATNMIRLCSTARGSNTITEAPETTGA